MMRCRSLAEMPLRRAPISNTARNHILSGLRVFSNSVNAGWIKQRRPEQKCSTDASNKAPDIGGLVAFRA